MHAGAAGLLEGAPVPVPVPLMPREPVRAKATLRSAVQYYSTIAYPSVGSIIQSRARLYR